MKFGKATAFLFLASYSAAVNPDPENYDSNEAKARLRATSSKFAEGQNHMVVDNSDIEPVAPPYGVEEPPFVEIILGVESTGYDGEVYDYDTPVGIGWGHPESVEPLASAEENHFRRLILDNIPFPLDDLKGIFPPNWTPPPIEAGPDGKVRVIIKIAKDKKREIQDFLSRLFGTAKTLYDFDEMDLMVISVPEQVLQLLQNLPYIEFIEADEDVHFTIDVAELTTNTFPLDGEDVVDETSSKERHRRLADEIPYGLTMVGAMQIPLQKVPGAKVCVIDDGFASHHSDLPTLDWKNKNLYDGVGTGHGTHVAGTIAARGDGVGIIGVAPKSPLIVDAYLNYQTQVSGYINAMRGCRDAGATVINMSFGCLGCFSQSINAATRSLFYDDNVLLVAAAGNHGNNENPGVLNYPASYEGVISVAALDSRGRRADFSGKNNRVDIAAPGVNVKSTVPPSGYGFLSGTSMAAPHVSGLLAQVKAAMPWLSASKAYEYLKRAARYLPEDYTGNKEAHHIFYPIASRLSAKCLDNFDGIALGQKLYMWECHGQFQQLFFYDESTGMIVNSQGLCIEALPPSNEDGSRQLQMWECDTTKSNQRWQYDTSTEQFKIFGMCLDIEASNLRNLAPVLLWYCHDGSNQKWVLGKDKLQLLCQNSNCDDGGRFYATFGDYPTMPSQIGDNDLTRVYTDHDLSFEYFQHTNFGGWSQIFGGWINLSMGGYDDAVSSFKVRLVPDGKVTLCKHYGCNSDSYNVTIGSYKTMPAIIGNDQLSRVIIPPGFSITYYESVNFQGWSNTKGSCDHGIDLNMGGHNDAVSSFVIKLAC